MSAGLHLRVAEGIVARGLWAPGARVAVAVSGGLDSVALLDLLVASRGVHRGRLSVATVDHGTRPDSAADAAFVEALAAARGLPCIRFDLGLGPSSEDACRRARYAALDRVDADGIALGHHRDDQAETALLALLRGGGARALSGMGWRRGRYVRPLLGVSRAELGAWATHRGLRWREDPTNASPDFLRNRVRHEVLPLLEALREGAGAALARAAGHAAEDEALLAALARAEEPWDGAGWSRDWVAEGPAPLVRRALLARLPGATSRHLDAVIASARRGTGEVRLPGGRAVRVVGGVVRVTVDG